jgi:hypothetical protein
MVLTGPGLFVPAITRPRMRTSKRPWRSSVAVPLPTHGTLPRVTPWIGGSLRMLPISRCCNSGP